MSPANDQEARKEPRTDLEVKSPRKEAETEKYQDADDGHLTVDGLETHARRLSIEEPGN
jgi:hypothetical protein